LSGDVGHGLPPRPPGDALAVRIHFQAGERAVVLHVELDPLDAQKVCQQHFRIEARAFHAAGVQVARRELQVIHHGPGRRHRLYASISRSFSARSCSARASITGWSSPSSTWFSWCQVIPMRWSVTRPCGKLYVRMRSLRSPVPTCTLRWAAKASACSRCILSRSLARRMRKAFSLFLCCDFSSWHETTRPVGRWVIRTAESVVLTLCPPGPLERYTSIRRSAGSISTSTSSASGSTATVAVEVWIRPPASVAGTRWTRWTPLSNFSWL